jgi:suppressor for copper-sensitivity B
MLIKPIVPLLAAFGVLAAAAAADRADAGESVWDGNDYSRARLVAAASALPADGHVLAGLEIDLKKGWITYWRAPGETGYPPRFDWSAAQNVKTLTVLWPLPQRLDIASGAHVLGYSDRVILPLDVVAEDPTRPVRLSVTGVFGVCRDICVPSTVELTLTLGAFGGTAPVPTDHAGAIADYLDRVPPDANERDGLSVSSAILHEGGDAGRQVLELLVEDTKAGPAPDAFIEGRPGIKFGEPSVHRVSGGPTWSLAFPVFSSRSAPDLAGQTIHVTLVNNKRSLHCSHRVTRR